MTKAAEAMIPWAFRMALNLGVSVAALVVILEPVALSGVDIVDILVPKGFTMFVPPAAVTRLIFAVPIISCMIIFAEGLLEESGGPVRWAQIQLD